MRGYLQRSVRANGSVISQVNPGTRMAFMAGPNATFVQTEKARKKYLQLQKFFLFFFAGSPPDFGSRNSTWTLRCAEIVGMAEIAEVLAGVAFGRKIRVAEPTDNHWVAS